MNQLLYARAIFASPEFYAEDAYRATGHRHHAMVGDAKKTMGIHGDERQLGDAGIHDDLVQRALMAAHVQHARDDGHGGLRERAPGLDVDLGEGGQVLPGEADDLRDLLGLDGGELNEPGEALLAADADGDGGTLARVSAGELGQGRLDQALAVVAGVRQDVLVLEPAK